MGGRNPSIDPVADFLYWQVSAMLNVARRFGCVQSRRLLTRTQMPTGTARTFATKDLVSKIPTALAFQRPAGEPALFFWDPGALGLDGMWGAFIAGFLIGSVATIMNLSDEIDEHYEGYAWAGFQY